MHASMLKLRDSIGWIDGSEVTKQLYQAAIKEGREALR